MTNRSAPYLVYADGSCLGNPGPGGWAAIIVPPEGERFPIAGHDPATTNNRMELTAAIEGLRAPPPAAAVILRSDSRYLVNTINLGWRRNLNHDLWHQLDAEIARRRVTFEWVEGHAGDPLNEEADRAARAAAAIAAKGGRPDDRNPAARVPGKSAAVTQPGIIAQPAAPSRGNVIAQLEPLLGAHEMIAQCRCCGRPFVTARVPHPDGYCALAACQLAARIRT